MAIANDTRLPELRAALQAMRDLPELLKPYTVAGTKLRVPTEIGDQLSAIARELGHVLDECHYEGVEYGDGDERTRQTTRGLVPAEGTTDGENGFYHEPTTAERREAIVKTCDANRAINEAMGALHSLHALGELLTQEAVADNVESCQAIGESIALHADVMRTFLDRAGGWPQGSKS
jgi:hypothetical protein